MITSSVILDVAMAAVVVLLAWIGAKRGLFRTLAELLSYVVAYIAASVLGGYAASYVVEWIRPMAEAKLHELAGDYLSGLLEDLPPVLLEHAGELPDLSGIDLNGIDVGPFIETGLYNISYAISFVVIFLLTMILLRLIISAMDIATRLPLIRQLNDLGGFLCGAVKGVLLVAFVLYLAGKTGLFISESAMEGSWILAVLKWYWPLQ